MNACVNHTYEWIAVDSRGGTNGKRYKSEANAKKHGGSEIVRRITQHHASTGAIWEGTESGHPFSFYRINPSEKVEL